MRIPGLIDVHVHVREPGDSYKEDWDTCTQSALAGGITGILAMPNTNPPITNRSSFELSIQLARQKARCDFAQYVGAGNKDSKDLSKFADLAAGMKMYLDQTFGPLRLDNMLQWAMYLQTWPKNMPLAVHAEGKNLAAVLLLAHLNDRPVHICHVSRREEILIIRAAKEKGIKVTCEVTPHHLFLTKKDIPSLGEGRSEVRPRLAEPSDQEALWENIQVIDCFATDHAPHLLTEKESEKPPPGFPGLETALPLLLTAVHERRLTIDDVILRYFTNPKRIFHIQDQPETWAEIDLNKKYEIYSKETFTKCGWTPFDGWNVTGMIKKVVLRGKVVYNDRKILAERGFGKNFRNKKS